MFPQLVLIGALVNLASTATYVWSTIQGRTKPNRMTFLMWTIAPMIATVAGYVEGVSPWALVPVFLSGFAPFLNFLSTFWNPNAYWKLGMFDYFCGSLSILALVLWGITKDPLIAIIFAILADAFAAVPTVLKAWRHPETEHWGAYSGSTFSAVTVFFATPVFTFAALAFPVYLILCNLTVLSGIYRKKLLFSR